MGNFTPKEPFNLKEFLSEKAVKKPPRYQPFGARAKPAVAAPDEAEEKPAED